MIGISFYLNDPSAEERIRDAGSKGVKRGFTSLHIPEEKGELAAAAKRLLSAAKESGIDVYADVSMNTPAHLGVADLFALKDLGVAGLRLDDFFDHHLIVSLAEEFKIAVNSSILFEEDLKNLLSRGLKPDRLIGWHNFYPRRETGLGESFFHDQNKLFKSLGIPLAAYIPSRGEKRGPLYEGLPTLEKHRHAEPFAAYAELKAAGIDDIYIGDPDIGAGLLEDLLAYEEDSVMPLRAENFTLPEGIYATRPDQARDAVRFMNTRTTDPVPPLNCGKRDAGTITVDNEHYGRYKGEVQITLSDLPADERVNIAGRIIEEDRPLLSFIKPGQKIRIIHI
ncbi:MULTISPECIES: MupG family TIM beta-alpha barrel fold protein [Bacillus]|uniref:MupG family TIM beta-alpha barrel fold protein n=1 Tax=Bacillus TaxID=1386 RepID=UPI001CD23660|nr:MULTISPECIES: MupG family TIM beta-alpha barrel fold protein [Bacillus]MCA1035369.1 MupG family TIM beta-alpha barrel fold protein [Bacillus infantis]